MVDFNDLKSDPCIADLSLLHLFPDIYYISTGADRCGNIITTILTFPIA